MSSANSGSIQEVVQFAVERVTDRSYSRRSPWIHLYQHSMGPLIMKNERSPIKWRLYRTFMRKPLAFSRFECPNCARHSRDQMPRRSSVVRYHCLYCNTIFEPLPGSCCVYCSYGDVPCPNAQNEWLRRPFQRTRVQRDPQPNIPAT